MTIIYMRNGILTGGYATEHFIQYRKIRCTLSVSLPIENQSIDKGPTKNEEIYCMRLHLEMLRGGRKSDLDKVVRNYCFDYSPT